MAIIDHSDEGSNVEEELDYDYELTTETEFIPDQEFYEDKICHTNECNKTAKNVLDWMDETVNPCDDFYMFACGKFINETKIPDDRVELNLFTIIGDEVDEQLREILNEHEQPGEAKPFVLAKRLYKACVNTELIEKRGNEPLIDLLNIFGGWPVVKGNKWSEDSFDWIETLKKFRIHGVDTASIFKFDVVLDLQNATVRACYVS